MKRVRRLGVDNDTALLWVACAAALCAGYYLAFGVLGAAIADAGDRTGHVAAIMLADAQIVARRPLLDRQERLVEGQLATLQLRADPPATVARFIRAAGRIAAAQHVGLVAIDERAPATGPPPPTALVAGQPPDANALEAIPLEVTLSGTYRGLLATICGLAQAPVAMQIQIASIERDATTDNVPGGPLTARLNIDLQRLSDSPNPPPHHASF